jgi:SNF2 family DNA or RNA helicase
MSVGKGYSRTMSELYRFQKEDVDHLEGERGVLIANEMGTGKTFEAIERDQRIREHAHGRTLVVAPLSTLESTWKQHFDELTNLTVVVCNPKFRAQSWQVFMRAQAEVFCVHWEALRLMSELRDFEWMHIIADECHRMKNRKAQQTRALKSIKKVLYKTAMSGTPVVNRPDELWSVLNWIKPKSYGSYWKFRAQYVATTTEYARGRSFQKVIGPMNLPGLHREMEPFYVRRLKKDVTPDLPDKYYSTIKVDLSPVQRKAYNTMRDEMIAWVGEHQDEVLAAPVVIAQLTRLQQFAVAFASFSEDGRLRLAEPSSKLDALEELLDDFEGQVVIFSRFKQLVYLVEDRLRDKSISYVTLTGDTAQEDRASAVAKFQKGDCRVFIGTIAAGGVGITLHASSTVIFLDRDWSPALNAQAEDRLHRIGQQNAVQVIDIIARNTVDLGKAQALDMKWSWIKAILGDAI